MDTKPMDIKEAASYLGLSVFTVRKLAKNRGLPAAKIGRAYRFIRDDLDSYIRTQYKSVDANAV